jgi:hypothetical protein
MGKLTALGGEGSLGSSRPSRSDALAATNGFFPASVGSPGTSTGQGRNTDGATGYRDAQAPALLVAAVVERDVRPLPGTPK